MRTINLNKLNAIDTACEKSEGLMSSLFKEVKAFFGFNETHSNNSNTINNTVNNKREDLINQNHQSDIGNTKSSKKRAP